MQKLSEKLNYQFQNSHLLITALTHSSISKDHNERLEFLGDAILDGIISSWLYNTYHNVSEGELTSMRAFLVKTDTLVLIAEFLSIKEYLHVNSATLPKATLPKSILADTVEAIFAAIFLDAGFNKAAQVILNLYEKTIDFSKLQQASKDPKSILQEYVQINFKTLPQYHIESTTGLEHSKQFVVKCAIPGTKYHTLGTGGSKQQAEKIAAEKLMSLICK